MKQTKILLIKIFFFFAIFIGYLSNVSVTRAQENHNQSQYLAKTTSDYFISNTDTTESKIRDLLDEIDNKLDNVKSSRNDLRLVAIEVLDIAKKLSGIDSEEGYARIKALLLNMDWSKSYLRNFYSEIYRHASYRMEFTDVYYEGLKKAPAPSRSLNFSCSAFRSNRTFKKYRFEPKYTYGLLTAMARVEESGELNDFHSTYVTCKESLRQHLLVSSLRNEFLETYLDSLNKGEAQILNRFLQVMAPPKADIALQMFKEFVNVKWYQKYEDWQIEHSKLVCEEFKGDSYDHFVDDTWVYKCVNNSERLKRRYYFYPDSKGKAIRLQKVRFSYPVAGVDVVTPLTKSLEKEFGKSESLPSVQEFGAAGWSQIHSLKSEKFRLLIFRNNNSADWWHNLPQVEMFARSNDLREWIQVVEDHRWSENSRNTKLLNRIEKTLSPYMPQISGKLDTLSHPKSIASFIEELINIKNQNKEITGAKLYLADLLVNKISFMAYDFSKLGLSKYGVEVKPLHNGTYYNHAFMRQILKQKPTDFWTGEAFLWALTSGTDVMFEDAGADVYQRVIPKAKEYLESNSKTHIRDQLYIVLGEAHETAWTLSQTDPQDSYVQPEQYQANAVQHLEQAIYYYKKLLKEYPNHEYSEVAKIKLSWLKIGKSTNSKPYYYFWD